MNPQLMIPNLCALGLALIAGCHEPERIEPATKASQVEPSDDLFASPRMLALSIEIAPHRLEALKQNKDSHEYTTCTVREGDRLWEDVGLRCRGTPAKELASGKPDVIVTFDRFTSGQRFHGHRRVILQSCREDPSYMTARIALEMFQAAGVPAPRCSFARIQLNERNLGIYLVIEGGAEREFLERHFTKTNGNLYDEGHPPDVTGKLEKARGRDRNDQSDVDALATAALQSDPALRWQQLQQRLDIERFLSFIALEVLFWQDDSYSLEASKFRLYHDPASDRLVFFPKCVERVLQRTDGPLMAECRGVVAKAVLTTAEGRQRYRDTAAKLLAGVFTPDKIQARSRELAAVLRPALGPEGAQAFDAATVRFLDSVTKRARFVSEQLSALPPD